MRVGVLWLIACLATATYSQFVAVVEHSINHSENSIEHPEDRNGISLLTSISKNYGPASYRGLNRNDKEQKSKTRELEAQEPKSDEKPPKDTVESETAAENRFNKEPSAEVSQPSGLENTESNEPEEESNDAEPETPESLESGPPDTSNIESSNEERVEQTTHGPVKGHKFKETDIYAFVDIPYGQVTSPFEAPHTARSWTDVHEIKEHKSHCPQYQDGYVGDLNCLTLSIFVPADAESASVLFYVHDSNIKSGDPMIYGPEHLVSKGVILVLPNYRIGSLGFLCLQNKTAQGNAGLKDLSLALEWTKNNIKEFGGNPSNIVVGGDGDAGALAMYLALCSPSKSNVHKVITESGSMLSYLAFDRNPVHTAETLAHIIRDKHSNGRAYDNTFAEAPVQTIVEAAKDIRFNPCIEHNTEPFMDVSPWKLLQNKEIDITFMIGSASHAGTHEAVAATDSYIEQLNGDYGLILPEDLLFSTSEARNDNALKIKTQYFGDGTITKSQITQLSLWLTDASYLSPLVRSARSLVDGGATVFLYEFQFVGDLNRQLLLLDKPVEGAVRSDIIGYLFTQEEPEKVSTREDSTPEKRMIDLMTDLWVSFIDTGIPTAENIQWEKLKAGEDSEEECLLITSETKLVKGVHVDRLRLWTQIYDEYFIERSFALALTPPYYAFITIIVWVTYTKLNYH